MNKGKFVGNFEKEIYTKITLDEFESLEHYKKMLYNEGLITGPTISEILRFIVSNWIINKRKEDGTYYSPFQGDSNFPPPNTPKNLI